MSASDDRVNGGDIVAQGEMMALSVRAFARVCS